MRVLVVLSACGLAVAGGCGRHDATPQQQQQAAPPLTPEQRSAALTVYTNIKADCQVHETAKGLLVDCPERLIHDLQQGVFDRDVVLQVTRAMAVADSLLQGRSRDIYVFMDGSPIAEATSHGVYRTW